MHFPPGLFTNIDIHILYFIPLDVTSFSGESQSQTYSNLLLLNPLVQFLNLQSANVPLLLSTLCHLVLPQGLSVLYHLLPNTLHDIDLADDFHAFG